MSDPLEVSIVLKDFDSSTVIIGGHDISEYVRSLTVEAEFGDATEVTLRLINVTVKSAAEKS